jgi:bacteriocin-like protein
MKYISEAELNNVSGGVIYIVQVGGFVPIPNGPLSEKAVLVAPPQNQPPFFVNSLPYQP